MATQIVKLIPIPSEVLTFIKEQQPHCTSGLIRQFICQHYDKNFTRKKTFTLLNGFIESKSIARDPKDKKKIIYLGGN